jgi:hypothetical protein
MLKKDVNECVPAHTHPNQALSVHGTVPRQRKKGGGSCCQERNKRYNTTQKKEQNFIFAF